MDVQTFLLERNQSLFENEVEINLTESGVHPLSVRELLSGEKLDAFLDLPISYGYTEGTPALRAAVASWYPGAGADNVLVTTGASEANFIVAWQLLGNGTRAALMVPNFMQLDGTARAFGADVVHLQLHSGSGWRLDFDEVRAALAGGVTLVSIVNPNNPSGKIMSTADMQTLVDLVEDAGAWLHVDEIYRGAEIGDRVETPTFWGLSERIIVTSSTSKAIAHAGLRLGWIIAPTAFIEEAMRRQDYTTIGSGPLNQFLAAHLLDPANRPAVLARSRELLMRNVDVFEAWLASSGLPLEYMRPEAGGMVFLRYPWAINSTELSRRAREAESVFVVAGDWFGMDGHLRIGIGGETEKLQEGLRRFERFARGLNDR